ncbi:MAG TPA: transcriptional regulator, partial [Pseudacidobacterium sp.]|nr:transcriptional regulator [Pseudacidobacterium sp.]
MTKRKLLQLLLLGFAAYFLFGHDTVQGQSQIWQSVGPDGGDARSLAFDPADPQHIYVGTLSSWIYESTDGGSSWKRLARLGKSDDLVVDSLIIDNSDPRTLYAGVWQVDRPSGGIYISHDSGQTWVASEEMAGQSVRALAQSVSNPKILVAGSLSGVYRSEDKGLYWKEISPPESTEIHEVESIAIDPYDPQTIYAGTWHLPWKTTDGGENWHNIKKGLIDDSDVFSIIIDPTRPTVIFTSACSGIYRSENAGELYRKVQGIPSTARRTRVLMQDPENRKIVYAGTTEGLYKTVDDGVNWSRMTGPDVIINDIFVDPKNPKHVLLATDRSGILQSQDGGTTFSPSNTGFSQRQVATILADSRHGATIYAGVLNDKGYGGVFVTEDGGGTWEQRSQGLNGKDVFSLVQTDDGTLLAGTGRGIYRWDGSTWVQDGNTISYVEKAISTVKKGKRTKHTVQVAQPGASIDSRVNDISTNGQFWYAATSDGVYRSDNQGALWTGPILKGEHFLFVSSK